jgi:hypothetical protein
LGRFEFFRKFAEIFAAQGAPPVSLTPVANGKNLQSKKFEITLMLLSGAWGKVIHEAKNLMKLSL